LPASSVVKVEVAPLLKSGATVLKVTPPKAGGPVSIDMDFLLFNEPQDIPNAQPPPGLEYVPLAPKPLYAIKYPDPGVKAPSTNPNIIVFRSQRYYSNEDDSNWDVLLPSEVCFEFAEGTVLASINNGPIEAEAPKPAGFDLQLMPSIPDEGGIPIVGKDLVVVALVDGVLHFLICDACGRRVVNMIESELPPERAREIEQLKGRLAVEKQSKVPKDEIISSVTSIVGHTQPIELRFDKVRLSQDDFRIGYTTFTAPPPEPRVFRVQVGDQSSQAAVESLFLTFLVAVFGGIPVLLAWDPSIFPWPGWRRRVAAGAWFIGFSLILTLRLVAHRFDGDSMQVALVALLFAGLMAAIFERRILRDPDLADPGDRSREVRILFVPSDPKGVGRLDIQKELKEIYGEIDSSEFRDVFRRFEVKAPEKRDVFRALIDHRPHVVHFCGHGDCSGRIILRDKDGGPLPLSQRAFAYLFEAMSANIRLVVLNGCYTDTQAKYIIEHINCAIGMRTAVDDPTAIEFAVNFYMAAVRGKSVQDAFAIAKAAIIDDDDSCVGVASPPRNRNLVPAGEPSDRCDRPDKIPSMRLKDGARADRIYLIERK